MPADHEKIDVPTSGETDPSVVYNKATGERIERYPIDCKELVATGEYSWTPPTAAEKKEAEKAEEEKLAEQAEEREALGAEATAALPGLPAAPHFAPAPPVAPATKTPAKAPAKTGKK